MSRAGIGAFPENLKCCITCPVNSQLIRHWKFPLHLCSSDVPCAHDGDETKCLLRATDSLFLCFRHTVAVFSPVVSFSSSWSPLVLPFDRVLPALVVLTPSARNSYAGCLQRWLGCHRGRWANGFLWLCCQRKHVPKYEGTG